MNSISKAKSHRKLLLNSPGSSVLLRVLHMWMSVAFFTHPRGLNTYAKWLTHSHTGPTGRVKGLSFYPFCLNAIWNISVPIISGSKSYLKVRIKYLCRIIQWQTWLWVTSNTFYLIPKLEVLSKNFSKIESHTFKMSSSMKSIS